MKAAIVTTHLVKAVISLPDGMEISIAGLPEEVLQLIVGRLNAYDDLVAAPSKVLDLCALGDVDESTEAYGWGEAVKEARAALAKAGVA